jgi:hypothetical protein
MSTKENKDDKLPEYLVSNIMGNTIFYDNDPVEKMSEDSDEYIGNEELKEFKRHNE